jgi:hypothetical protein
VAGRISYTAWLIGLAATARGRPRTRAWCWTSMTTRPCRAGRGAGQAAPLRLRSSDTFGNEATGAVGFTAMQSVLFHRADLRYRHPVDGGELEAGVTWGLDGSPSPTSSRRWGAAPSTWTSAR